MKQGAAIYRMTLALGTCLLGAAIQLRAADPAGYPNRPLRLVLPFAAGGGGDTVARVVTPKLYEALGQRWVIDNRDGAAGNIAAEIVARAEPDGYTIFMGLSSILTVNPLLYKPRFNVQKDFMPVSILTAGQYMLVLHPTLKAATVRDFIELAKAQPGSLNYASAGVGTPLNLAGELFKSRTGISMTHVPYKGGRPALAAVLAGEVKVMFGALPTVYPYVKTGQLKALAVTGPRRPSLAPEIPTVAESGFPGFSVTSWYGLLVPARTPAKIVNTLYNAVEKVMQLPDVKEQIARHGLEVSVEGTKAFAARIRQETILWTDVIKSAGIKLE